MTEASAHAVEPGSAWAREYVGLPWTDRGASREGVSCWGLIVLVYRERLSIDLPTYEGWGWDSQLSPMSREAQTLRQAIGEKIVTEARAWLPVSIDERRCFDVFLIRQMGWPCHVGLCVSPDRLLHAEEKLGVACERLDGARFMRLNRIIGCYRHADFR